MKALITGGAGFIGSHLAEYLLARGYDVDVIDDLSTGTLQNLAHLCTDPRLHTATDSVTNERMLERLVSTSDVIYHLAAVVGVQRVLEAPVQTIETNVMGTAAVLRVAHRYGRKVVLASTSEVYGKSERVPFGEDDDRLLGRTTVMRWCYGESKALDEFLTLGYARQYSLPVVIVRLFNTVGPRQSGRYGMVVPRFVRQALAGEPLTVYGDGTQTRCFADVRDVVRGVVALAECPPAEGQVFNLGSQREISINELARLVISVTGSRSQIVHLPLAEVYGEGFEEPVRRVPDVSKVKALVGWEATTPLTETIHSVAQHLRSSSSGPATPERGPGARLDLADE